MSATAEVIEPDTAAVHAPGTDLARFTAAAVPEEYRARFVMEPHEAKELDRQLRDCMKAVLVADVDYGTIPGMGNKPSLFKPGAEKLIQWFGFGFETVRDEIERDREGARLGVTYKCTVYKQLTDGRRITVATCEGYAGYDEDKFYTPLEAARAKAEANERKWANKDNRAPNPKKWESAAEYRAPWNSVLKMAQKRALVGAAIDATAAAGLFTQDIEDMRADAAADSGAFTDAARDTMMALPDDVRADLDRWYRGKRWPDPSRWTAEQWCTALQTAGYLTARREQPKQERPAERPQERAAPQASEAATVSASLDPGDPWQIAIDGAVTTEDTAKLREELAGTYPHDDPRVPAITAAIDAREAALKPAGGERESTFVRAFRARIPGADETTRRSMRIEIAKAVSAKTITPDEGNALNTALREAAEQAVRAA